MKRLLIFLLVIYAFSFNSFAQQEVIVLSADMFKSHQRIFLAPLDGWIFRQGNDPKWADLDLDSNGWETMNPTALNPKMEDENGRLEGWFRIILKLDDSLKDTPFYLSRSLWAATDVYLDGKLIHSFGNTGDPYQAFNPILKYPVPIDLEAGKEYLLAIHFVDYESTFTQREIRLTPQNLQPFINLTGPDYTTWVSRDYKHTHIYVTLCLGVSFLLFFLYWFLLYLNPDQTLFRIIAWYTTVVLIGAIVFFGNTFFEISYSLEKLRFILFITFQAIMTLFGLFILEWVLTQKISRLSWALLAVLLIMNIPAHIFSISQPFAIAFVFMLLHFGKKLYAHRLEIKGAKWTIVAAVVIPTVAIIVQIILHKYSLDLYNEYDKLILSLHILTPPLFYLAYISVRFKETLSAVQIESQKLLQVTEEKREILANQNILLEAQVTERTKELKNSLENLKATQAQLIQQEKLASLGQLTAGIAHEIKNPLNFVNNFSEVSIEIIGETLEEMEKRETRDETIILENLEDIQSNLQKIHEHGSRANSIVTSMLQHSRGGSGEKEPTDLNALIKEYVNLSFHGMRAGKNPIDVEIVLDLDPEVKEVALIKEDFTRVIINLCNNAFDAMRTVTTQHAASLSVNTKKQGDTITIEVADNGPGIPDDIKDKILQPFFTTKKGTEGTGLGLSITHDIVKVHGGEIKVESEIGKGTTFTILLNHKPSPQSI
ncbi:sensor histidine kinase [Aquiflexum gelatinilyticum]|uniref:sensor histidine kinase n=1 Tax=Aquiflexum gelatinilyticum TaxID=2961943 RepID=UPI002169F2E2|nr:ATP-binding protein [Aquiflexum gelatinilyticum]MCS4435254.1 ATP-binding protein [Aquiflexum gelatinilyticum]